MPFSGIDELGAKPKVSMWNANDVGVDLWLFEGWGRICKSAWLCARIWNAQNSDFVWQKTQRQEAGVWGQLRRFVQWVFNGCSTGTQRVLAKCAREESGRVAYRGRPNLHHVEKCPPGCASGQFPLPLFSIINLVGSLQTWQFHVWLTTSNHETTSPSSHFLGIMVHQKTFYWDAALKLRACLSQLSSDRAFSYGVITDILLWIMRSFIHSVLTCITFCAFDVLYKL